MIVDLTKASQALNSLEASKGAQALEEFYGHLESFRKKLGVDLNDAEFRYVMQTLFNEQIVTVPPAQAKAAMAAGPNVLLPHGFTLKQMI
jgi:hypothetical protein